MATTHSICGDFEEATRIDYGQCRPRRLKRDCDHHRTEDVAAIIAAQGSGCEDENISTEYFPELDPPFRTIATVFDPDCDELLDTDGEVITGPTL